MRKVLFWIVLILGFSNFVYSDTLVGGRLKVTFDPYIGNPNCIHIENVYTKKYVLIKFIKNYESIFDIHHNENTIQYGNSNRLGTADLFNISFISIIANYLQRQSYGDENIWLKYDIYISNMIKNYFVGKYFPNISFPILTNNDILFENYSSQTIHVSFIQEQTVLFDLRPGESKYINLFSGQWNYSFSWDYGGKSAIRHNGEYNLVQFFSN